MSDRPRKVKAALLNRIRKLAVENRYPADWIAERLELEKYPRLEGRWSGRHVERLAAEHGIALYPHKPDSLALWKPKHNGRPTRPPPDRQGTVRRRWRPPPA